MNNKELQQRLDKLREGIRLLDSIVYTDCKTGEGKLNEKQVEVVQELFKLFSSLNWQLAFNDYKELKYDDSKPIDTTRCGTPVRVRSCKDGQRDKTYFGILIGDVPLSIEHSIDKDGVVTCSRQMYNPAIFIPELNDIVYGCESWWGEIENEEDLQKMITDEAIQNVWYMKLLKKFSRGPE